jgi:hypothetical protein
MTARRIALVGALVALSVGTTACGSSSKFIPPV